MGLSTVYDVRLRYTMEDRASRATRKLERDTAKASAAVGMLRSGIMQLGGVAAAGFGLQKAGQALIGFNSDLDQAKIQMAGLIKLNLGGEWSKNMGFANRLVSDFTKMAEASAGTTKDFVDMASMIVRPVTAAGASMQELEDFTRGAVIASKAFGIQAEVAALDVEQALAGTLTKRERFANALLAPMGFDPEKFNKLSAKDRFATFRKALSGPAITDMAKAQETSFAGVLSTFEDKFAQFMGKVGLPLFKALTAEIQKWNKWIDENSKTLERTARELGSALVDAFSFIKDVAVFFAQHADTLLMLAKAWAGLKIGRMLAGGAAGVGGAGSALQGLGAKLLERNFDTLGVRAASLGGSILSVTGAVARFTPAIGLAIGALEGLWSWWKGRESAETKAKREDLRESVRGLVKLSPRRAVLTREILQSAGGDAAITAGIRQSDVERAAGRVLSTDNVGVKLAARHARMDAGAGAGLSGLLRGELAAQQIGSMAEEWDQARAALAKFAIENQLLLESQGKWFIANSKLQDDVGNKLGLSAQEFNEFSFQLRLLELDLQRGNLDARTLLGLNRAGTEPADGFGSRDPLDTRDAGRAKVNITINSIEVQSDDPDRFAFGLVEAFRDAAKNPSSAVQAFREG